MPVGAHPDAVKKAMQNETEQLEFDGVRKWHIPLTSSNTVSYTRIELL